MKNFIHVFNLLNVILPGNPFFELRRKILSALGVQTGANTKVHTRVTFYGNNVVTGENVWIAPESKLFSTPDAQIRIGNNSGIGPGSYLVTGTHEIGNSDQRIGADRSYPITIGDGCWVGARVIILGGATIGKGCVVAAGAVILPGNYEDNSFIAGVPATIKKRLD